MTECGINTFCIGGRHAAFACWSTSPRELLTNIPRLVSAYYTEQPNPEESAQLVAFGTSGHRGRSTQGSFNEAHILAVCQALVEYRQQTGITGPLFMGRDTHALSEPAEATAIEDFAANGVELRIADEFTPTPLISHAILTYNRGRVSGLADGVVITPSHNPPEDGGFKYNPPSGGPAGPEITNGGGVHLSSGKTGHPSGCIARRNHSSGYEFVSHDDPNQKPGVVPSIHG